jgi:hypothetical protein
MTTEQKQRLFDRLTRNVSEMTKGDDFGRKLVTESALEDIEAIAPLIDIFLAEERIKVWGECRDMIAEKFAKKGNADGISNNAAVS